MALAENLYQPGEILQVVEQSETSKRIDNLEDSVKRVADSVIRMDEKLESQHEGLDTKLDRIILSLPVLTEKVASLEEFKADVKPKVEALQVDTQSNTKTLGIFKKLGWGGFGVLTTVVGGFLVTLL